MKILRLYTRLPPLMGGMERHIEQLTIEQIKLGHEVTIFFNGGEKVTPKDVKIAYFPLYKLKPQFVGILFFHFLILLRLVVTRQRFDVIHVHGDWSTLVFLKLFKRVTKARQSVLTVHDELRDDFFYRKVFTILSTHVDIVFSTGFAAAQQINQFYQKGVVVQPSGVNDLFFEPFTRKFSTDSFRVITVANLVPIKNLNLVLDIAKDMPKVNFIIVGDGSERGLLLNRINTEHLFNVSIVGRKSPQEVRRLYQLSDAFLLTSTMEGTPTSILEAMACGLPILSTDAGGISAVINDKNFIIKSKDKNEFVKQLNLLLNDKNLLESISNENVKQSRAFRWSIVAKKYDDVFLEED